MYEDPTFPELPEALHISSNNITNAKTIWESSKSEEDVLLAIYCKDKEMWKNPDIETGYRLDLIK